MRRLFALLILLAAACPSKPPQGGGGGGTGTGATPDGSDASGGGPAPDAGTAALTEAECGQLIDHVLDVQLADMRTRKQPDEMPTDERVAELRTQMRAEMMDGCLAWSRPSYDCIMAAADLAGVQTCAGEP
jgi:hypothetical protein